MQFVVLLLARFVEHWGGANLSAATLIQNDDKG